MGETTKEKRNLMILLKPVLTGPTSTNKTETKERMAMMTVWMQRIKVRKSLALSLHQRTKEEERKAERHQTSNINIYV